MVKYNNQYIQATVATNMMHYQMYEIEYLTGTYIQTTTETGYNIGITRDDKTSYFSVPEIALNNYTNGMVYGELGDSFPLLTNNLSSIKQYITNVNKVFNNGFGGTFKIKVDIEINDFVLASSCTINASSDNGLSSVGNVLSGTEFKLILAQYTDSLGYTRHFVVGIRV